MAITLTDVELAQALGLVVDDTPLESPLAGIIGRLLGVGEAISLDFLPDGSDHIHNEICDSELAAGCIATIQVPQP